MNCYRLYVPFMGPDYRAIPSSIISEGIDIWEGAGDRGDAAMYLYGAPRFLLALGDRKTAEELWPAIEWCVEYCLKRKTTEGVIASDSDELEGNHVLRSWICLPLTMGIMKRYMGTVDALFSPGLWTEDGLATQAGDKTFWDRSTLYGFRAVFMTGETEKALKYLACYSKRRLLGDHVVCRRSIP